MRKWIVAGVALVLLGFATTLAIDIRKIAPIVFDADEPVLVTPPPDVESSPPRTALERDRAPSPTVAPRDAPDAGDAGRGALPQKLRDQVHQHPDGSTRDRVGVDENGAMHGLYASWYPGGAPWETGSYAHGKKEGVWRTFHEGGAVREESTWVAGVQRGRVRQWDPEGRLLREAHYDGTLEGPCTTWYSNGQMESRGSYAAGRREGRWEYWLGNAELDPQRSGVYHADQRTGD